MKRLAFPAPLRETYNTPHGWSTRKWTLQGVLDVLSYGGWFLPASEFDCRATARAAGTRFLEEAIK
mgnify:CR=1 FL=1